MDLITSAGAGVGLQGFLHCSAHLVPGAGLEATGLSLEAMGEMPGGSSLHPLVSNSGHETWGEGTMQLLVSYLKGAIRNRGLLDEMYARAGLLG